MKKIKVEILNENFDGMALFLAKLTQRGHQITSMNDLIHLYSENKYKTPSTRILSLPHDTISRMSYMTVAIYGLSTKAVSQLRTHATNLTFISTSTQYSSFADVDENEAFVLPLNTDEETVDILKEGYQDDMIKYRELIDNGLDKDEASYKLPQALRKCLIISGHFPAWRHLLQTRMCLRNTKEVRYICQLIIEKMNEYGLQRWSDLCHEFCKYGPCPEGNFSCMKGGD